jgi:2-polyprenyl-3-methyl-5-hydroxy-6-metoxy-1,4-benzoquinol methylase
MKLVRVGEPRHESHDGITQGGFADAHSDNIARIRTVAPSPARVLDIGAWRGAFARRLKDADFEVEACDLDPSIFQPSDIRCFEVNLNDARSRERLLEERSGHYDVVAALEIIEHVEDPWTFLRFARHLARPGGYLLLTTPNPANFFSRLTFLRTGIMHQFAPSDESYGHINPLTTKELDMIFRELGYRVCVREPVGDLPFFWLQRRVSATLKWTASAMLSVFMTGDKQGWCMRYLAQVPEGMGDGSSRCSSPPPHM